MKVMMLIQESAEDFDARGSQGPAAQAYWQLWQDYSAAVNDRTVGGNILDHSNRAVTISFKEGERQIQDGPFADSKEILGGYMIFEVETMDEAVQLASTCPCLPKGAVELRPLVEMS